VRNDEKVKLGDVIFITRKKRFTYPMQAMLLCRKIFLIIVERLPALLFHLVDDAYFYFALLNQYGNF